MWITKVGDVRIVTDNFNTFIAAIYEELQKVAA